MGNYELHFKCALWLKRRCIK